MAIGAIRRTSAIGRAVKYAKRSPGGLMLGVLTVAVVIDVVDLVYSAAQLAINAARNIRWLRKRKAEKPPMYWESISRRRELL